MILLDTHVLLWWLSDPKKLSKSAARAIKSAKRVGIPAICTWEFSMLVAKQRIRIDRSPLEWLELAFAEPGVELLPLTIAVAVQSSRLRGFHGDPSDGLIVATAQLEGAPLVTKDQRILDYEGVETIWE